MKIKKLRVAGYVISAFLLFEGVSGSPSLASDYDSAYTQGESSAGSVNELYSSKGGLTDRAVNPLTTDTVEFSTVDGEKQFTANVSCASSDAFLITTMTTLSTGDVSLRIEQDIDMDGAVDYTNTYPTISGVCANGFIVCSAGTWSSCNPYRWQVDSGYRLSPAYVDMAELSGCSCINNSCVSAVTPGYVLDHLGGGAVAALQTASPQFVTSSTEVVGSTIRYLGQNPTGCNGVNPTATDATGFYYGQVSDDPFKAAAANDQFQSAGGEEAADNKYYNLLANSQNSTTGGMVDQRCTVIKEYTIESSATTTTSDSGSESVTTDEAVSARVVEVSEDTYEIQYKKSSGSWTTLAAFGASEPAVCGGMFTVTMSSSGCVSYDQSFDENGLSMAKLIANCSTPSTLTINYTRSYYEVCDTLALSETDNCIPYEEDPSCTMKEEKVDGITTYSNFNPTGASLPSSTCRTISGSFVEHYICEPWWSMERVYVCESNATDYDYDHFADALDRTANVDSTTDLSGSSVSFTDRTVDEDGNVSATDYSATIGGYSNPSDCVPACKVSKPDEGADAGMTQQGDIVNADQYQSSGENMATVEYYKKCSNGSCPLEEGETMIKACSCPDDFTESATQMEVLDTAVQDMICSSGTAK